MLKKIILVVAVLLGGLLIVIALQPAEFRIERSAQIRARPEVVFPFVDDLHAWNTWSPWAKLDPNMKTTYSGAEKGKGAIYEWAGNSEVGSGRMEIIDERVNEEVTIKLDFLAPFAASNITMFKLTPDGDGTRVLWAMTGKNDFMSKGFSLFMDMDKMVGDDFEKGLADLSKKAEAQASAAR
jgi:hypothetical protein